jgi:biotin synthase-like enzyme
MSMEVQAMQPTTLSEKELQVLLKQASAIHKEHFGSDAWFGKCIFLSWYCSIGDCTFCYRSTLSNDVDPLKARRSLPSIIVEAVFTKELNWELEFLTGGYGIFPFDQLVEVCKIVSEIIEDKVWLNMGTMAPSQLEKLKPYVKGIVASIETINPKVHEETCPSKPIAPYSKMLKNLKGFKKSMTHIIGMGETIQDFELLKQFIEEHQLDKITFYALKPVKKTVFEHSMGPDSNYYAEWIARTRIAFPKIEIMAGITPRRAEDVKIILEAGANAVTKFSATKLFNSERAHLFEKQAKAAGRTFKSHMTKLPKIDWNARIEKLSIDEEIKNQAKQLLADYLVKMMKEGKK